MGGFLLRFPPTDACLLRLPSTIYELRFPKRYLKTGPEVVRRAPPAVSGVSSDSVAGLFAHGRVGEGAAATRHDVIKLSVSASPVQRRHAHPQDGRGLVEKPERPDRPEACLKRPCLRPRAPPLARPRAPYPECTPRVSLNNVTHSHTCSRNSIRDQDAARAMRSVRRRTNYFLRRILPIGSRQPLSRGIGLTRLAALLETIENARHQPHRRRSLDSSRS